LLALFSGVFCFPFTFVFSSFYQFHSEHGRYQLTQIPLIGVVGLNKELGIGGV
jgi:hypothetical protein